MRILATGSEGSLMQWVIRHLLAAGHDVVGADNSGRYGYVDRPRDYDFRQGDLCDAAFVAAVCQGVDAVIQSAAQIYGVRGFHQRAADILSNDTLLHTNLLREIAGRRNIVRFVYISSSMVYERAQAVPTAESQVRDMPAPLTDYGLSKLVGERLCQAFGRDYGLPYTIWRPFNIITPLERASAEPGISHVFADFISKLLLHKQNPMDIIGDGEQVRCFTWIDDVAAAIARHSFGAATLGQAINLGNPEPVTMRELAQRIFTKGQQRGIIDPAATLAFRCTASYADDVRQRVPDIALATQLLGWRPSVSLDAALEICLDHVVAEIANANAITTAAGTDHTPTAAQELL